MNDNPINEAPEDVVTHYQQEIEALTQRLQEAEATAHRAQLHQWRLTAVASEGLPPELADRLLGDNAESIAEDARRLAKIFPVRKNVRTGHASDAAETTRARQIFDRIEGRQGNPFDILLQRRQGGGVFGE